MHHSNIAAQITSLSTTLSPYPASFDNSPVRYALALASLMSMAMLGAVLLAWMSRDMWLDRGIRPKVRELLLLRRMVALIGAVMVVRCLPEVVYMAAYGEVTGATMAALLAMKRSADIIAFPIAAQWTLILVSIYPGMVLGMQARGTVPTHAPSEPLDRWHRLGKPILIFAIIVLIASLIAYAKWTLAHHG